MTDPLYAACARAVHVVRADGTVLRGGRATLFILERLGWGPVARLLSYPPLIWPVELGYAIVARHRGFFARFFFREEQPG
jgi:predicted DCC family thiol-disulfide oxidoreductase YuxK